MKHFLQQDDPWIIVTDLDGTLLDHNTYSHAAADAVLADLESANIPVIFNSSKTRPEMLALRAEFGNRHPFIVENGSAVYIPENYFAEAPTGSALADGFYALELGRARSTLVDYLNQDAAQHGAPYLSFSQASTEEIVAATGLPFENAQAAGRRDFSEPLLWKGSDAEKAAFCARAEQSGLKTLEGGRFLHLLGDTDKGRATLALLKLYESQAGGFRLAAAGDSPNDMDMLSVANLAVIVRGPHRLPPQLEESENRSVVITQREGPAGWSDAMSALL